MTPPTSLSNYQSFVQSTVEIQSRQRPFYIMWVEKYLLFIERGSVVGPSDDSLDTFVHELKQENRWADWQLIQARKAARHYLEHFVPFQGASLTASVEGSVASLGVQKSRVNKEHLALLGEARKLIEFKHYSPGTRKPYLHWIRHFLEFFGSRKPSEFDSRDAIHFLSHLATNRRVSASTQNQAFNALLFLFKYVLKKELKELNQTIRAKRRQVIPTVLTADEVRKVFVHLEGTFLLIAQLIYGSGMRLIECLRLRVKDIDFERSVISVCSGKGGKDRVAILPQKVKEVLKAHLEGAKELHQVGLKLGNGRVPLPDALGGKRPQASKEWAWQWIFPSKSYYVDQEKGEFLRTHIHPSSVQKAVRSALLKSGVTKYASVHTLRHSFATHLLESGCDIKTIQELMGHRHVNTTMIYMHVALPKKIKTRSPLDFEE